MELGYVIPLPPTPSHQGRGSYAHRYFVKIFPGHNTRAARGRHNSACTAHSRSTAAASARGVGCRAFKTKLTPMPASFQGLGPTDPQGGPGDDQGSATQFGHIAAQLKSLPSQSSYFQSNFSRQISQRGKKKSSQRKIEPRASKSRHCLPKIPTAHINARSPVSLITSGIFSYWLIKNYQPDIVTKRSYVSST